MKTAPHPRASEHVHWLKTSREAPVVQLTANPDLLWSDARTGPARSDSVYPTVQSIRSQVRSVKDWKEVDPLDLQVPSDRRSWKVGLERVWGGPVRPSALGALGDGVDGLINMKIFITKRLIYIWVCKRELRGLGWVDWFYVPKRVESAGGISESLPSPPHADRRSMSDFPRIRSSQASIHKSGIRNLTVFICHHVEQRMTLLKKKNSRLRRALGSKKMHYNSFSLLLKQWFQTLDGAILCLFRWVTCGETTIQHPDIFFSTMA